MKASVSEISLGVRISAKSSQTPLVLTTKRANVRKSGLAPQAVKGLEVEMSAFKA